MVKQNYPHKEQRDNDLSSFVETTYSVYGHVSVRKIIIKYKEGHKKV